MKIDMSFIPDGQSGKWKIETFEVKEREISQVLSMMKSGRGVPAGTYKRLMRGLTLVMSNTPDEIHDFLNFVFMAKGDILINGLGLGCVVKALLEKRNVNSITVIEKSEDVINLVKPYFKDERLRIIHADAYEYKPERGVVYDFCWHDIWDDLCADNLPEMAKLHRKYGRRAGWQGSWGKEICQRYVRQNKLYYY